MTQHSAAFPPIGYSSILKLTALLDKPLKRLKDESSFFINTSINRGVNELKILFVTVSTVLVTTCFGQST
ncbi:MAG: hypothetical protein M0P61_12425 [Ignavibacteriaceae bacterium]|jgi:hypothetical protein|nr:hypothetical protein [Ignavibacteriaceae bacterium]